MGTTAYAKYRSDYDFGGKSVLNVGCGFTQFAAPNVVNLDSEPAAKANVTWDLSKTPLPFRDETFDLIIANHILEHVPDWWECFKDLGRVLKTGGVLEIWLPGDATDGEMGYRDHINTINGCSFWGTYGFYRNPGNAWAAVNEGTDATRRLRLFDQQTNLNNNWWITYAPHWLKAWMNVHLRNIQKEKGFFFTKLSPPTKLEDTFKPVVDDVKLFEGANNGA